MNKEFIGEWVAELRTGNRKQTKGTLHRIDDDGAESFCCLGVAMDMLAKRGLEDVSEPESLLVNGEGSTVITYGKCHEQGVLTADARKFIGLPAANPEVSWGAGFSSLAELNDEGYTFKHIADAIEAEFLGDDDA